MLRQRQPHGSLFLMGPAPVPRPGSIWPPGCRAVPTVLCSRPAFSWCCSPALITAPMTLRYSCFIKYQNPLPWASVQSRRHFVSLVTLPACSQQTVEPRQVLEEQSRVQTPGATLGLMPLLLPGLLASDPIHKTRGLLSSDKTE